MGWELDYFDDGDALTAAVLTDKFNQARLWINSLENEGFSRGMFNHHHAAPTIRGAAGNFLQEGDDSLHGYDETTFGASLQYATFSANNGSDDTGSIGTSQWTIVGHPDETTGTYSAGKAEIVFSGGGLDLGMTEGTDDANISAVEVLFNCAIIDAGLASETDVQVVFCIQYQHSGSVTWWTLPESQRFYSVGGTSRVSVTLDDVNLDATIRVIIDETILDENGIPGTDQLTGIRAMVSKYSSGGSGNVDFTLGGWTLTAIPWRGADVP